MNIEFFKNYAKIDDEKTPVNERRNAGDLTENDRNFEPLFIGK